MKSWDKIKDIVCRLKDLTSLGVANVTASVVGGIFWVYLASLLGSERFGEISYFIAISSIVGVISLLGAGSTLIVYTAKGKEIQSPVFFISIIFSLDSSKCYKVL